MSNATYKQDTSIATSKNNNSENRPITPKRVNVVSLKMVKEKSSLYAHRKITSPSDAADLLRDFLENSDREMFLVCCLDSKNQPTCINVVSIGTLNSSLVHPREVFKAAILANSHSILVAHNHPSDDLLPSKADTMMTDRMNKLCELMGIPLIDHVIVGGDNREFFSFKEKGLISNPRITLTNDYKTLDFPSPMIAERGKVR